MYDTVLYLYSTVHTRDFDGSSLVGDNNNVQEFSLHPTPFPDYNPVIIQRIPSLVSKLFQTPTCSAATLDQPPHLGKTLHHRVQARIIESPQMHLEPRLHMGALFQAVNDLSMTGPRLKKTSTLEASLTLRE